jgi:hypothetical protein
MSNRNNQVGKNNNAEVELKQIAPVHEFVLFLKRFYFDPFENPVNPDCRNNNYRLNWIKISKSKKSTLLRRFFRQKF